MPASGLFEGKGALAWLPVKSRWLHKPEFRQTVSTAKRTSWLALLYDLVVAAALLQLGHGLAGSVSGWRIVGYMSLAVPLIATWIGFTFYESRYRVDDLLHRSLVIAQLFSVGAMALTGPAALAGSPGEFALAAAASHCTVALMYFRSVGGETEARAYTRYWGGIFLFGGGLWAVGVVCPAPLDLAVWAVAALFVFIAALTRRARALSLRFPTDWEHLSERHGLVTLIVLGESFVTILSSLMTESSAVWVPGVAAMAITTSVWWVYFDDVAISSLKETRGSQLTWLYAHAPLLLSLVALGSAIASGVHFRHDEPAAMSQRWLLAGSLAGVFASVAALDSATERVQAELNDRTRVIGRLVGAGALCALVPAGSGMSGRTFLSVTAALAVLQVVFDVVLAPASRFDASESRPSADVSAEAFANRLKHRSRRPDILEAVRRGAPSALRRDVYFYLMEGGWLRAFVGLAVAYVLLNLFFAGLYMLEPGSVVEADGTFLDAFFFSVQTMSTIGYGTMHPATPYADAVVTVEAAVGMFAVALATGLLFAKASRPRSSVLFSDSMTITEMDGAPVLTLRLGNARGNEIVDASVVVSAVMDESTREGHHLRRLRDLKLVRSRSPLFVLTWTVMHRIDESSPLFGFDLSQLERVVFSFVVTMTGHDSTYGSTVHGRRIYYTDDVRLGQRFVDVIRDLPDGRLLVDYTRFHDTRADGDPRGG